MAEALGWSETAATGWLVLVAGWWGSLMILTETKREVQWRERGRGDGGAGGKERWLQ